MIRVAAIACVGCAMGCAVERAPAPAGGAVGGDAPLAAQVARGAADVGIPADELAAASWVRTRFRFASDPETALRAAALALRDGTLGDARLLRDIDAALARGISGLDANGRKLIVTRRSESTGGLSEVTQGLDYTGATWVAASTSNYQVASRGVGAIDHIVIHDTEGSFAGSVSWVQDPAAQVSAHFIVRSSDGRIDQKYSEKNIAWHDACFNANTIGIEHEGYAAHPDAWFTEAMYEKSAALTAYLADKYGIAKEHGPLLGHGEAPDCSARTDPGAGWSWGQYVG